MRSIPIPGQMRQSGEVSLLYRCSPSGRGRGPVLSSTWSTAVFWTWVNPATPMILCSVGPQRLLEGARAFVVSRSWSNAFILEMRSLRCQIPQPVRNRSGSQIQSSGPSSSTLNIWPAASCSCGSPYVSNTSCLSGDPEAALAWQSQNSDSRVCRALTTSWSSSQTRQARLNDLEGA